MLEMKLLTVRFDKIDPLSIEDYLKYEGYKVLKDTLMQKPDSIIEEITKSRLSGRGGAGFPTSIKFKSVAAQSDIKYLICNADEGEPGNFKDRTLMERDPHQLIEGMVISAYATGINKGFIYIRGEYQNSIKIMTWTIEEAKRKGFLGKNILNSNFDFDIEIRSGAGSYICGEEFALIESIEGKPGRSRVKPPFPTTKGVFGKPTLINNVETLSKIPYILKIGGESYSKIGNGLETGTKLISLSGNVRNKGVFEVPYGTSIRDIIYDLGKGIKEDRKLKMVQLSGASGPLIPPSLIDMEIDNENFDGNIGKIGAGAIIVVDERFDLFEILLKTMKFFEHESCGKCTPCREGHIHLVRILNKFVRYTATTKDLDLLESIATVVGETSLCGLGQTSPSPILTSIKYFNDEYLERINKSKFSMGAK